MKTEIVFAESQFTETNFAESHLLKLIPYGISLGADQARPMLILKDEQGEFTLPVAVNPLEAGVTLSQSNKVSKPSTPHKVTELLLHSLNIKISKCIFVEIKSAHQYVNLYFEQHPYSPFLRVRADEAMSLCLHLNVPLFASKEFMNRSRQMSAEVENMAQGLSMNPEVMFKTHPYMM